MKKTQLTNEFLFQSHYKEIEGLKIHYVDEGSGEPIIFLHGIPTWSYLWRNVIPVISQKYRCIAPDLIGMGLSDKPDIQYTVFDHIHFMTQFLDSLDFEKLTLVMHGWGSVIGFHYAMQHEKRIKGLAFLEAHIRPVTHWDALSLPVQQFLSLIRDEEHGKVEVLENNYLIETILPSGVLSPLSADIMAHYRKPFPSVASRKPLLQYIHDFPKGNGEPADVVALIREYSNRLKNSDVHKLMFYGVPGFMTNIEDVQWAKENFSNLDLVDLGEVMHFAQECCPLLMANEFLEWYENVPVKIEAQS